MRSPFSRGPRWWHFPLAVALVLFYCEVLHYEATLHRCGWGAWPGNEAAPLRAFLIADTHLLGRRRGHWFDKLRREWQMGRAFAVLSRRLGPELVFLLGDLFDEGQWSSAEELGAYEARLRSLFPLPSDRLVAVAGNHDVGFHYAISPPRLERFEERLRASSVRLLRASGVHFALLNSMALEGDGCRLCGAAEKKLKELNATLECQRDPASSYRCDFLLGDLRSSPDNWDGAASDLAYSPPFLLQHFPLWRRSDADCDELDGELDDKAKAKENRERWEALSRDATARLISQLRPRAAFDGHTHAACRTWHRQPGTPGAGFWEWTVSSFSWRNRPNPGLLLLSASRDHFVVEKCLLPDERTVIGIYFASGLFLSVYLIGICLVRLCQRLRARKVKV